mgnify:CR=1 FL=1
MNINLQTLIFTRSDKPNNYVNEKVGKLVQQYPDTSRVDVTLKEGAKNNLNNKWCELYLSLRGDNKFAKKNSASYEESILKAVAAMEKTLRRLH